MYVVMDITAYVGAQMKRFIQGEDRTQIILLRECLDDYVGEASPVRVIDVFVDELDLGRLGFDGVEPAATGRPSYHPAVLLKLYTQCSRSIGSGRLSRIRARLETAQGPSHTRLHPCG
jgi:hypothetical protein